MVASVRLVAFADAYDVILLSDRDATNARHVTTVAGPGSGLDLNDQREGSGDRGRHRETGQWLAFLSHIRSSSGCLCAR